MSSRSVLSEKQVDKCDVVVCGGTLGIFIATALIAKGLKVCIVERNILKGVRFSMEFIVGVFIARIICFKMIFLKEMLITF